MVDTLEIAKKLEGAGFQRQQAEAVAAVMAGGVGERDKQLEELRIGLEDVKAGLVRLEQKMETLIAKARTEQIIWTVGALGVLAGLLRLFP